MTEGLTETTIFRRLVGYLASNFRHQGTHLYTGCAVLRWLSVIPKCMTLNNSESG